MKRPSGAPSRGPSGLRSLARLPTWLQLRENIFGVAWAEPLTAGPGYPGSRGPDSPAHMYPSQEIPASLVILKILQSKLRKDQPGDLMELLSLALEVGESFSLLLVSLYFPCT